LTLIVEPECTGHSQITWNYEIWRRERHTGRKREGKGGNVENSQRNVSPMSVLIVRANTISKTPHVTALFGHLQVDTIQNIIQCTTCEGETSILLLFSMYVVVKSI
jgi:hypothetical protein